MSVLFSFVLVIMVIVLLYDSNMMANLKMMYKQYTRPNNPLEGLDNYPLSQEEINLFKEYLTALKNTKVAETKTITESNLTDASVEKVDA